MAIQGPLTSKNFTPEEKALFKPLLMHCIEKELTVQQACEKLGEPALAQRFKLFEGAKKALIKEKKVKKKLSKNIKEKRQAEGRLQESQQKLQQSEAQVRKGEQKFQQSKEELRLNELDLQQSKQKISVDEEKLRMLAQQKDNLLQSIEQKEKNSEDIQNSATNEIVTQLPNVTVGKVEKFKGMSKENQRTFIQQYKKIEERYISQRTELEKKRREEKEGLIAKQKHLCE